VTRGPADHIALPPEHLVDRPAPAGWARVGVGTAPFNIISFMVLVAISCFIVRTPSPRPLALAAHTGNVSPGADAQARNPLSPTTSAIAAPMQVVTLASASVPATPVTAAHEPFEQSGTKPYVPKPQPKAAPKPAVPKPVTCDSFPSQPLAQTAFDANPTGLAGLDGDHDGIACEHLPGRVLQTTAPEVPTVAALLRPYTRLYGVHTPNAPYRESEIADFAAAAGGKRPNTLMFFQNFGQDFPADAVAKSWADGALPMVTLEPIVQESTVGQPTLLDISAGNWDQFLQKWATAAAASGQPFALRFAQEMNGDWYPWSDAKLGNKAGDYAKAWRHVHDLFAAAGAKNVIWVWSVNRVDNLSDKTLTRVYPGDAYVDWAGISGYYRSSVAGVAPTFDGTFKATLAELKKVAPSKLVMLTEVGAGTTVSNRTAWIASFFHGLLDHPEVIGFNWFNDFKDGGDWRIQYAQATADAFAAGVADLRYGSLVETTEPAPNSPALTVTPPPSTTSTTTAPSTTSTTATPSTTSTSAPTTTSTSRPAAPTLPATTSTTLNAAALGVLRKQGTRRRRAKRQRTPKYPVLRY